MKVSIASYAAGKVMSDRRSAADAPARFTGRCNGNHDQDEQACQQAEGHPGCRAPDQFAQSGQKEAHAAGPSSGRICPRWRRRPGATQPSRRTSLRRPRPARRRSATGTAARDHCPSRGRWPRSRPCREPGLPRPSGPARARTDSHPGSAAEDVTAPAPASVPRAAAAAATWSVATRTRTMPSALRSCSMGPSRTSRPAAMMPTTSAICCISASRWLETKTVLPSDAR